MRLLLALHCLLPVAFTKSVVSLSDQQWTVMNDNSSLNIPASFPSHVHLDLFEAGIIDDPYRRLNEYDQRWIGSSKWTYVSALTDLETDLHSTWLLFEGLDTFATIRFCDKHVANTNNQFRQYHFDVTRLLQSCPQSKPLLAITFDSAIKVVDKIAAQPGQETWPPYVEQVFEYPNRQFMRKQQSDFGWDWGPAFAPAGPWLPGYVIQLEENERYVFNSAVDIYRLGQRNNMIPDQSQSWVINCSIDYFGAQLPDRRINLLLSSSHGDLLLEESLFSVSERPGFVSGHAVLEYDMFQDPSTLWWPNGLGRQQRFTLDVGFLDHGEWSKLFRKQVGFRTIVLNQDAITDEEITSGIAPGDHWHFEINGHPFFAKGSNFIPPDIFWPRVTEAHIRQLFNAVVASNQNMVRLWSSGVYVPDFVYEIADELGILLWSEFQFGDSLYPVDQDFLYNVYEEAVYQVRRVNHHPSLAFWAGGNELENLELALLNKTATEAEYIRYKDEYERLFLTTLFPAVFENTRSISYAPSSTSNGYISLNFTEAPYFHERYDNLEEGHIYGETDYYNYDPSLAFDTDSYPIGRFSNEFGYHSMPSLQTWRDAIDKSDLHFNSTVIQLRNRHYPPGSNATDNFRNTSLGMGEMTRAAQMYFPWPNKTDPLDDFAAQCHTTQLFQASFYVSQIQHYRLGSALPHRTLGALYWQLNDIWQAPTWSSIEYGGRWKVLHYAVKRAFEPVVVQPTISKSDEGDSVLEVWVLSDLWTRIGTVVRVRWFLWSGQLLTGYTSVVYTGPLNGTLALREPVLERLPHGIELQDVAIRASIRGPGYRPNSERRQVFEHEMWIAGTSLAEARLVDPGLMLEFRGPEGADGRVGGEGGGSRNEMQQAYAQGDARQEVLVSSEQDASNASGSTAATAQDGYFSVTATMGIAAWVWLDYPRGAVVEFDDNGFWLAKGQARLIDFKVVSDTTEGKWLEGVTVSSMWDNTV